MNAGRAGRAAAVALIATALAAPAAAGRAAAKPRRSAVSKIRSVIGPTGMAIPNPAASPATNALIRPPPPELDPARPGAGPGDTTA